MLETVDMKFEDIKVESPFKDLFAISEENLKGIREHMDENDYDETQPIVVWKENNILIDGHTRYKAAREVYYDIPVILKSFASEKEAVEYAIHLQTQRRNLTDWDILKLVELIDERSLNWGGVREALEKEAVEEKMRGEENKLPRFSIEKLAPNGPKGERDEMKEELLQILPKNDSRRKTAVAIGISMQKVSHCRRIIMEDNQETLDAIEKGKITISKAYTDILMQKENATLRRQEQREARALKMEENALYGIRDIKDPSKKLLRRLTNLCVNLLAELLNKDPVIKRIRKEVEYFKDLGPWNFETVQRQPLIQEFLTSPFVDDFLAVLECFGFSVQYPEEVKPTKRPEKPKKKGETGFDISRVHDADYAHNRELRKYGEVGERAAEADIREGNIR